MTCDEARERFSPWLEGRLGRAERGQLSEHLLACRRCRRLGDEMRSLLRDLRRLAAEREEPEGLAERVVAAVPPPSTRRTARTARGVAWSRAAAWALVFFGAWWQLVGAHLGELAADQVAPTAASWVADAREATLRRRAELLPSGELGIADPVDRARDSLAAFSRGLHRALFVPQPRESSSPQTRPVPPAEGEPRP